MGMKAQQVAYVHDELQFTVPVKFLPDSVDSKHQPLDKTSEVAILGEYVAQAIREVGEELNMNCPLDGDYKVGYTWEDTH